MISRYLVIITLSGVALVAACAMVDEQSRYSVYMARYDWIEQRTPENSLWSHCVRTERESCQAIPSDPNTFQCSYREWAPRRPWPLKRAMVRLEGDTWRWVEGDTPSCSMTVLE